MAAIEMVVAPSPPLDTPYDSALSLVIVEPAFAAGCPQRACRRDFLCRSTPGSFTKCSGGAGSCVEQPC
ncbi:MAG: hypothetical protein L0191_20615, partial [Acidobacteria bacterium]|nr:hypothetical protein [Acidobacteriota bacterium]